MRPATRWLLLITILFTANTARSQEPEKSLVKRPETALSLSNLVRSYVITEMAQMAGDLRAAAESMDRFGKSMAAVSEDASSATQGATRNLAAIGGEFDPLGLKAAFQTIKQQNEIIQQQHETIMKLQNKQLQALRRQLKDAHSNKTPTKPSKPVRKSDKAPKTKSKKGLKEAASRTPETSLSAETASVIGKDE